MSKLIVVGGASGAGKSFLLEKVQENRKIIPIKKISTRKPRQYEIEKSSNFFDICGGHDYTDVLECDYIYEYIDDYYGFNKYDIDNILSRGYNPIVIVKSSDIIMKLKSEYNTLSLYITSVLSGKDLIQTLSQQGRSDIEISARMQRIKQDIIEYSENILKSLYNYVIINYYDETLQIQINNIFNKELT